jgi:hypothetical protein
MNISNKNISEPVYKKFEREIRNRFQAIGNYTDNSNPILNKSSIKYICNMVEPVALKKNREPSKLTGLSIIADVVEHDSLGNVLSLIEIKHHKLIRDRSPIGDVLYRIRDSNFQDIEKNHKMMFETKLPYAIIIGHYYEKPSIDLTLIDNACDYTETITVIIGTGNQFVIKNMSVANLFNTAGLNSISELAHTLINSDSHTTLDYERWRTLAKELNIDLFDNVNEQQLMQEIEARAGIIKKQSSLEHQILTNHESRITHLEMLISGLINNINNDAKQMMMRLK